jgi:hypothetical protein
MAKDYGADPTDVKNFTTSSEVNLDQNIQDYSEFLPIINRTESLQRFFGATVNQLLSSGSTQSVDAYWGRLAGRNYNPDNELFRPESTANRLNYQFQPGVVSKIGNQAAQTTSYINWLDRIQGLGADLSNHDRVFSEPGYVLDLPINSDMFVNYSNYYWLEGDVPLVVIEAVESGPIDIDDIVSRSQYSTPFLLNDKRIEFVTGLRITFSGNFVTSSSGDYPLDSVYYVENVGGEGGIKLLEVKRGDGADLFPQVTPYYIQPRAGWDGEPWDSTLWDGVSNFEEYNIVTSATRHDLIINKSFIVMERWARDKNPWARSNNWFSIHALRAAVEFNELDLEAYVNVRTRADRPIIEFYADIELYDSCKNFAEVVDYVITLDQATLLLSGVDSYLIDSENAVQNGDIVLVAKQAPGGIGSQTQFFSNAYVVSGVGTGITLTPYNTYQEDDYVVVGKGTEKGLIYCFKGEKWSTSQNKPTRGSAPLFNLYDQDTEYLGNRFDNDFQGDPVFTYKISTASRYDRELGLSPTFTDQGSFSNFEFEWSLGNRRYNQNITVEATEEIQGQYFFRNWVKDEYHNGWSNVRGGQRVPLIQTQVYDGETPISFELGTTNIEYSTEYTVSLQNGKFRWYEHSYIDRTPVGHENPEFVFKYDTDYTINDLIADPASKIEMVNPYGDIDNDITYTGTDTVKTFRVNSDYIYDKVIYRRIDDNTVLGEIFLNNDNQKRIRLSRNGQNLRENIDYTITGTTLDVTISMTENDVIELSYIADADLQNVVYDVAPVHFYNSDNNPFEVAGYDDLINHLTRQMSAMPGFNGELLGQNNYHKTMRLNTYDGLIRQQIFRTKNVQHLLDQEDINPIRALKTFSQDYADFKQYFKNKVRQLWTTESWNNVREIVDRALTDINIGKNEGFKYAHSDMLYYKQARSITYIINEEGVTEFKLPEPINRYGDTQNHIQVFLEDFRDNAPIGYERPLEAVRQYYTDGESIFIPPAVLGSSNVINNIENVVEGPDNVVIKLGGERDPTTAAILTVRWYDYKQISNVPFSAVKLGFFKPTRVEIVDGELIGHDGSRHTMSGNTVTDFFSDGFDVVTAALLDFELRVFNNLVDSHFVDQDLGLSMVEFYPNPVGEFSYSIDDLNSRLDDWYNRWAVRNNVVEIDQNNYDAGDEFTWNYNSIGPNLGSWRSLYVYNFGTDRPHTHPWEMLGHFVRPNWWKDTYSWTAGPKRDALLNALQNGITGNAATPNHIDIRYARPNYNWTTDILVTDDGTATLNPPVTANVIGAPAPVDASRDFVFGDWSDVENVWRKSSEYLYALAEVFLQLKPYRTHESFWTLDSWYINRAVTQDQWIDSETFQRKHITEMHNQNITEGIVSKITVVEPGLGYNYLTVIFQTESTNYRTPTAIPLLKDGQVTNVRITNPGRGFANAPNALVLGPPTSSGAELEYQIDFDFIVTHLGFNSLPAEEWRTGRPNTNDLVTRLDNLELSYMMHLGGFSDKRIINIDIDGDYQSGLIRVPQTSYDILLDRNAPVKTLFYSGVKIEKLDVGYRIDGFDLDSKVFNYFAPSTSGNCVSIAVGNTEVVKHLNWRNEVSRTPYRTVLRKRQDLYQFLLGLGKYYESLGFEAFTQWEIEAREAILWALDNKQTDNHFVNGIDDTLIYHQGESGVVQTVDINYDGVPNVLDSKLKLIRRNELQVLRDDTTTEYTLKNGDDRIYGLGVRVVEFEHIVTIDNITTFNDPIYQPALGVGQNRARVLGEITRNWNGRVEAPGYLVQDRGLVLNMENSVHELETEWVTSESKALERLTRQTIGYNVGYSKPTYMTNLFVSDKSAYRFEQGLRKYKGTPESIAAMARNKNIFGSGFEHSLYEEWMVRMGDYGDISQRDPIQFEVDPNTVKTDPQHFRFNSEFRSDSSSDLIIDLHKNSKNAISGDFDTPFDLYDLLPLNNTSIAAQQIRQTFTQSSGLPLVTEIDYFLKTIDNIDTVYSPTEDYALIPNWSSVTSYVKDDRVRFSGEVYRLGIDSTGITIISNDIVVRGTQVRPLVPNGTTFIANGETVVFTKLSQNVNFNSIFVDSTGIPSPVTSGDRLIIDGVNIDFIKTATVTTYSDITLIGNVFNPEILNGPGKAVTIGYANTSGGSLTNIVTIFDEVKPTQISQSIIANAFDQLTNITAIVANQKATARITALEALRTEYLSILNTASDWETFIGGYFDQTQNPDTFINPEYLGEQVLANSGSAWEFAARNLIDIDLDLLFDVTGFNSLTQLDMVNGRTTWLAADITDFDNALSTVNSLLDNNINSTVANESLAEFVLYLETNGSVDITLALPIAVPNSTEYVTDELSEIVNKLNASLIANGAPSNISVFADNNVVNIERVNNTNGYRLGVVDSTNQLGFDQNDQDEITSGSTQVVAQNLTLSEVVTQINNFFIPGVTAQIINSRLRIQSTNQTMVIGNGSANSDLLINAGSYIATTNTTTVPVDLQIGDVVTQINNAAIPNLTASQVEGTLILNYIGETLVIGDGTANSEIGLSETTYESISDEVENAFNLTNWIKTIEPADFNIWIIDNVGSDPSGSLTTSNRYNVLKTIDFEIGVLEICAGAEAGDDALIRCDKDHTLSADEYVLIINSSCVPSLDGIHQITRTDSDRDFYIDRYIEEKGFTGKVIPLRSVRFPSTQELSQLSDSEYSQGTLGIRSSTLVYVDEYQIDGVSQNRGAVYRVSRNEFGLETELVRLEDQKTDNSKIKNGVLFSNKTEETVLRFEVFDPLKGIIPGIAAREIDIRSDVDYAYYNNTTDIDTETRDNLAWGQEKVGTVWWDLSNAIYLDYDQSTPAYRQEYWGKLFPTSTIDVYEWTKSPVTPDEYLAAAEAGTVIDGTELSGSPYVIVDQYGEVQYNWSEEIEVNRNTNQTETYFYFWVRNKTTTPDLNRIYSVLQIADIILDPESQQLDWIAATSDNTLLVSSLAKALGYDEIVMQVNFDKNESDYHQEFILLAENDPVQLIPEWLHISLRDSLAGFTQDTEIVEWTFWNDTTEYQPGDVVQSANGDFYRAYLATSSAGLFQPANPDTTTGNSWMILEADEINPDGIFNGNDTVSIRTPQMIPDLELHPFVRYGIETRPHQTWFVDLEAARRALVEKINDQLSGINLLNSDIDWQGEFERVIRRGDLEYDLTDYWNFADWSRDGFKFQRGVGDYFVEFIGDLADLDSIMEGAIAQVERSNDIDNRNRRSVWRYESGAWTIIYKERGTIRFNNLLWDNSQADTGWDVEGWDTREWDKSSSLVTVEIFSSFYNRIWSGQRSSYYTDLWFHMAKYVLAEQQEVDWIVKTSYFKMLVQDQLEKQYNKYFTESPEDFFDFITEVKPFHSKLRDGIVRKVADEEYDMEPLDYAEIRIQTNPAGSAVDETETRAFRLHTGTDGIKWTSSIENSRKQLLGKSLSPDGEFMYLLDNDVNDIPDSGALWINSERIEYINLGSGGGLAGSGLNLFVIQITARATQGTLNKFHKFLDVVEFEVEPDLNIIELDTPVPAWNDLGDGLLEITNTDPIGTIIRNGEFGTIELYGDIQLQQWLTDGATADAIETFENQLSELIEVYWSQI